VNDYASPQLTHRQIQIVFGALMLGILLAALDQTVLATALPTIVGEFSGLDHLSWVITAYMLTSTATVPLYGKLSDLYGRKPLFQLSICIFVLGSVLSGAAQSMNQLILFRGLQGIGAGGIMTLAMAIVGQGGMTLIDLVRRFVLRRPVTIDTAGLVTGFYKRILLMHAAIMIGAFVALKIGSTGPLVVLVLLKTMVEFVVLFRMRRDTGTTVTSKK